MEKVIRDIPIDTSSTIFQKLQQITEYADDLNILGKSIPTIKETFGNLEIIAKKMRLKVNKDKIKFILHTRK